jgi:hypothetical protein
VLLQVQNSILHENHLSYEQRLDEVLQFSPLVLLPGAVLPDTAIVFAVGMLDYI